MTTPPTPPTPAPTANLSASPANPQPNQSATLTYSTTNAVSVAFSSNPPSTSPLTPPAGPPLPLSGTLSITPSTSTIYTLTATGAPGTIPVSAYTTVLVAGTPAPTPTPAQAAAQVKGDIAGDISASKGAIQTVAAQARVEYDALSEAAKGRIHTLLNDIESAFSVSLANIHSLFGAGSGSTGGVKPTLPTPPPTPSSPAVKAAATHPPAPQDQGKK